jgi:hypothetical protein
VTRNGKRNWQKRMTEYRVVPDSLRELEPVGRGRKPQALSRDLLAGKTILLPPEKKNFGSLYTLAKKHGKRCIVKKINISGATGTRIWFEDIPPNS